MVVILLKMFKQNPRILEEVGDFLRKNQPTLTFIYENGRNG
ncbi:hypothetical protein [Anabaena sp. FACHB-1237]|nr:hypothetical protein [Anabaena sp. FACHB-1237]